VIAVGPDGVCDELKAHGFTNIEKLEQEQRGLTIS
jgi:hypothetical protein